MINISSPTRLRHPQSPARTRQSLPQLPINRGTRTMRIKTSANSPWFRLSTNRQALMPFPPSYLAPVYLPGRISNCYHTTGQPRCPIQRRRSICESPSIIGVGWSDQSFNRVHAFFAFNMHAGRLFHGPSFLANLDLPPTHSNFPCPPVLNAICAVGSLYTADIPPTPVHTASQYPCAEFRASYSVIV